MNKTYSVSEEEKKEFASAYLLERMIKGKMTFPLWLEGNDKDLEQVLEFMLTRDYVEIQNDRYVAAAKGRKVLANFSRRYTDYLKNFDVFCAVDLEEGNFAFESWLEIEDDDIWDAYLSEDRWEDLRVAVAAYKGLNPVEIVFMSFLNEQRFGDAGEGWQFDLLLGSIWDEILEICNTALTVDDLGYEGEDGPVSGKSVIEDIMKQGAELNRWLRQEEGDDDEDENASASVRIGQTEGYQDPDYVSPVWRKKIYD